MAQCRATALHGGAGDREEGTEAVVTKAWHDHGEPHLTGGLSGKH